MKRFFSIIAFLLIVGAAFLGLLTYGQRRNEEKSQAEKSAVSVYIYTDFQSDVLEQISPAFSSESGLRPVIVHVSQDQLLHGQQVSGHNADIYITSENNLKTMQAGGLLKPYYSSETDTALNLFKDPQGYWTGIWIDPIVFVVNDSFALSHPAFEYNWNEVFTRSGVRLSVTDFAANDLSEDLLLSFVEHFGEKETFDFLTAAQNHIVQYGKYLSTPSRMAAMNTADIGISDLNEAEKTKREGLPIRIIFPSDGSPWYLYGAALSSTAGKPESGARFIDWILDTSHYKKILEGSPYRFFLINDVDNHKDDAGQIFQYWPLEKNYTKEGKDDLLKLWIDQVRFGGK